MKQSNRNKRQFARAIYCTEAMAETDDTSFTCFTLNLTPAGILIKTKRSLSLGQKISLFLQLPQSSDPAKVMGTVVRLVGECVGIKFDRQLDLFLSV